jgi:hypothetical protein
MEAVGVIFIILIIGILGAMLIDRSWVDEWMKPKHDPMRMHTHEEFRAYIRMWPKPKVVLYDQEKDKTFEYGDWYEHDYVPCPIGLGILPQNKGDWKAPRV